MKILLIDDHEIARRGLKLILGEALGEVAFSEAATAAEALDSMRREDWNLVILDLDMPGRHGLDVLAASQARCHLPPVLAFGAAPARDRALSVLRRGAAGYLGKSAAAAEIGDAVRRIVAGGRYIPPAVVEQLADAVVARTGSTP